MRIRRNLPLFLIFVIIATIAIPPSFGAETSVGIFSSGIISYPEEPIIPPPEEPIIIPPPEVPNSPPPEEFSKLHTDGKYIKNEAGQTVYLQGSGVYAGEWYKGTIDNQQFSYMKDWGFNVIRITIPSWTIENNRWQDQDFRQIYLDMIQFAKDNEIYVVVSVMHLDNEDPQSLYSLDTSSWSTSDWTNYIQHVKDVVTMTRNEDHVLYDLLNEPLYLESYSFYRDKMEQAIDAVRSIDPDAICIVEEASTGYFGEYGMNLEFVEDYPIERPNIIYSPHLYQAEEWDITRGYSEEDIRERFDVGGFYPVLNSGKPIWIGEFNSENSYVGDPSLKGEEFLRNMMNVCKDDGFSGWCVWAWGPIGRHQVIDDFNGTPSETGQVIKEYLMDN